MLQYQTRSILACGIAGVFYVLLYFWSSAKIKELGNTKNRHGTNFQDYRKGFFKERGFPFIAYSLVLPLVLGSAASASLGRKVYTTVGVGISAEKNLGSTTLTSPISPSAGSATVDKPVAGGSPALNSPTGIGNSPPPADEPEQTNLTNIGMELIDAVLVVLVTLEIAYWTGSTFRDCHSILQSALLLDLCVLISLLIFVGPAPAGLESSGRQLFQLAVVGTLSIGASYRIIYTAALWDLFKNQPKHDVYG